MMERGEREAVGHWTLMIPLTHILFSFCSNGRRVGMGNIKCLFYYIRRMERWDGLGWLGLSISVWN